MKSIRKKVDFDHYIHSSAFILNLLELMIFFRNGLSSELLLTAPGLLDSFEGGDGLILFCFWTRRSNFFNSVRSSSLVNVVFLGGDVRAMETSSIWFFNTWFSEIKSDLMSSMIFIGTSSIFEAYFSSLEFDSDLIVAIFEDIILLRS